MRLRLKEEEERAAKMEWNANFLSNDMYVNATGMYG